MAAWSQWRTLSLSTMSSAIWIKTSLDYAAAEVAARLAGLEPSREDFAALREMEAEAIDAWAEDRAARK